MGFSKDWWRGILEQENTDVLDSFKIQESLNPKIWSGDRLKDNVRDRLLKIAQDFFKFLELKTTVKLSDITLTGSISNYNWSKYSDIDLHVRIKFGDVDDDIDFVRNYFLSKKSIWNDNHDITIHGFPVEVYVENVGETHVASGLYSILNDKWIVIPKKKKIVIDKDDIKTKVNGYLGHESHIKRVFKDKKYTGVISIVDRIFEKVKKMRQAGLEKGGEYSVENLAFKVLRRNGFLQRLDKLRKQSYDKQMTLERLLKRK